jgi:PERQ amino acid-rich with GYF domain-containing protein
MEEMRVREHQRRQLEEQQQQQRAAAQAAEQAQALLVSPNAPWYYSDPQNNIQGPFRANEMRQWLEAGYFKGDLPISQQPSGPFRPLSLIFPNLSVAFTAPDNVAAEASAAAAAAREAAEKERLEAERLRAEAEAKARQEAAERERKAATEAAARAELERERRRAEEAAESARREVAEKAEAAKNANGGNESSAQLKMMLGMSGQGPTPAHHSGTTYGAKSEESASGVKSKSTNAPASAVPSQPKPHRASSVGTASDLPRAAPPAPSPWGTAAQTSVQRKSMSEIQKEEARASALLAMQREGSRSSSSGWANVAASRSGSGAWAGGAAKPSSAAAVLASNLHLAPPSSGVAGAATAAPRARQASVPSAASAGGGAGKSRAMSNASKDSGPGSSSSIGSAGTATGTTPAANSSSGGTTTNSSSTAEEFGAKMSPAMEKWCKDQMTKLNGTDDLTLVSFCMTLSDPGEIRQYLTAYLGTTPQVNGFATEFISRRGFNRPSKQDEWESTATAKKTRKSHKGKK